LLAQAAAASDLAFASRPCGQRLEDSPLVVAQELAGRVARDLRRDRIGAAKEREVALRVEVDAHHLASCRIRLIAVLNPAGVHPIRAAMYFGCTPWASSCLTRSMSIRGRLGITLPFVYLPGYAGRRSHHPVEARLRLH
jgi:hypothetical protein